MYREIYIEIDLVMSTEKKNRIDKRKIKRVKYSNFEFIRFADISLFESNYILPIVIGY